MLLIVGSAILLIFFFISAAALFQLKFICEALAEFYYIHVAPRLNRSVNLKRTFGEWAIVTGATDGIGKGYVFALAAKGLSVVLVGRNEKKLQQVISDLTKLYPLSNFLPVIHDFSKQQDSDVPKLTEALKSVFPEVGMLVNNVGVGGSDMGRGFGPDSLQTNYELVQVNINSMLLMTSLVLPKLKRNRKGIIVNISSVAAVHPAAGLGAYNGSKAFVDFFSRSLRQELREHNVLVQTVYPGFVKTKILAEKLRNALPACVAPDYMSFSRHCVSTIGVLPETYGCCRHRMHAYLIYGLKCLPVCVSDLLLKKASDIRAKFLDDPKKTA